MNYRLIRIMLDDRKAAVQSEKEQSMETLQPILVIVLLLAMLTATFMPSSDVVNTTGEN